MSRRYARGFRPFEGGLVSFGRVRFKSNSSPPPAPDAAATAAAQGQANTSTAAAQTALNLVNQNTPYGTTSYAPTDTYTTPNGETVPRYTQTVTLSPLGQQILTGEQGVASSIIPAAQQIAGQVGTATTKPIDFNTPYSDFLAKGPQQINSDAANAIYGQQKSFLDPQWENQQQQLQDQLSRQGIPVGSEAYNNAMKQLDNARTQAYQSAQDSAVAGGSGAASNLFGMARAGQDQSIQQQQIAQQQPLSLLSQLFGATPSTPQQPISTTSPTGIAPTDVVGATALQNNAAMQQYQAQTSQNNSTNGAVAGLATAAVTAAALY